MVLLKLSCVDIWLHPAKNSTLKTYNHFARAVRTCEHVLIEYIETH